MSEIALSTRVLRDLEEIEDERFEYDKLLHLYNNLTVTKLITEIEREFLTQRIETVIRTSFPKQYGRVYGRVLGNKNEKPLEVLEQIRYIADWHFDLSDNLHKNGVKVGGSMIGGREYIAWYISYKNRQGWGTSLAYRQTTPEDDPRLEVRLYQVGSDGEHDDKYEFRVEEWEKAKVEYMSCLTLVDCPQKPNSEGVIVDWEKSKEALQ